jgi:fructoselysine-6-phosphate deglycase
MPEPTWDPERYLRIQTGAVQQGELLAELLAEAVSRGSEELVFLGTGGVNLLMDPAVSLVQDHSRFPVSRRYSAEYLATGRPGLSSRSVVIVPSLSGTTLETVAAARRAKAEGARLIALTGHPDTPLAELVDVALVNEAADDTSSESYFLQTMIGVSALPGMGGVRDQVTELTCLPELLTVVKERDTERAGGLARALAAQPWHIFTAAGPSWTVAHYFAMCILEEMQWIRTRPVHASDFFHGTLELVEPGVSVVLLKDASAHRAIADRIERFVPKHTEALQVIDVGADLPTLSEGAAGLAGPILLAAVLERAAAHLELLREHPLTTRRYYRREEY